MKVCERSRGFTDRGVVHEGAEEACGQREAELAGMGHGRTRAAAEAMTHALELADFYEAEVASLRKSLEREVLLRNEQKHTSQNGKTPKRSSGPSTGK